MDGINLTGTRRVAAVSMFTALAVATDYAMFPLADVKLMDCIVFVAALTFGVGVGASVGALTWLIYGTVNPLGADTGPLLLLLILSEMVYVAFGYVARRLLSAGESIPARSLLWGSFGLVGAFAYDFNTIFTPYLLTGQSVSVSLAEMLPAAPFMLAHEVSDFVFFATVAPLLYVAVRKAASGRALRVEGAPSTGTLEAENVR
ncbi:MAG: hypothetical protein JRN09_01775 [Nitrososphaerota archaeon]|jgi:hypothetical protein|nr:hypothetical protein [Nitrososphaerota archaeon]